MVKILIVGSGGFIGKNLLERVGKKEDEIVGYTHKKLDISDYKQCDTIIKKEKPEVIINAAVYGGYPYQKDKLLIWDTNFYGAVNLLKTSIKNKVKLFIQTGSNSEYGIRKDKNLLKEKDNSNPSDEYSHTKLLASKYCQLSALSQNKTKILVLRIFSAYGYYEKETRLMPQLMLSSINKKTAKLDNPKNVRSYTFIKDICNAYQMAINKQKELETGSIFNIASDKQSTLEDVVYIMREIDPKFKFEWSPNKEHREADYALNWHADITKAKRQLGWKPKYNLKTGMVETYNWFKVNNYGKSR